MHSDFYNQNEQPLRELRGCGERGLALYVCIMCVFMGNSFLFFQHFIFICMYFWEINFSFFNISYHALYDFVFFRSYNDLEFFNQTKRLKIFSKTDIHNICMYVCMYILCTSSQNDTNQQ